VGQVDEISIVDERGPDEAGSMPDRGVGEVAFAFRRTRRRRKRRTGGTANLGGGDATVMSGRTAGSALPHARQREDHSRPVHGLDPAVDFERYREPTIRRFIAMARANGQHSFHDLDELAKEFYNEFWTEWLERGGREFSGSPTAYIAQAMTNKLRDLSRRGRSVRAPELLRADNEEILAAIASDELEPSERVALQEQMWLVNEVVHSLPPRQQVAFAAVFARDSKKKGSPVAGYRLAAQQLGVSERRAKKLSLEANKRIRAAVQKIEAGRWCDRWARSIELVAAGREGEKDFAAHAEHCLQCRLGVVQLRRQAAILPLPATALAEHAHLLPRLWGQVRDGWNSARHQAAVVFGRHASTAADASGIAGGSGATAGAGITAFKLGAVCLGVGLTGGAASVCLQAAGVPVPVISALTGSKPAHHHRVHHPAVVAKATTSTTAQKPAFHPIAPPPTIARRSSSPARPRHNSTSSASPKPRTTVAERRSITAAQTEFNPGGGSGSQIGSSTTQSQASSSTASRNTATSTPPAAPTSTSSSHHSSGGTVPSGQSNDFTAP
jgi:RNA polymerase sigma factor (sigma-70 family)